MSLLSNADSGMLYRPEIDGLRAIAVLAVILFHLNLEGFSGGYVGVDIFFVISGYLITSIYISERYSQYFNTIKFYISRARRIFPGLLVMVFISFFVAWLLMLPKDLIDYSNNTFFTILNISNLYAWRKIGYFSSDSLIKPLLHLWSLAIEVQFYLIFPILFFIKKYLNLRKITFWILVLICASLLMAHWMVFEKPSATYYLLPFRVWEFLIGLIVALYMAKLSYLIKCRIIKQFLSTLGFFLVIFAIFVFDEKTPFPSFYALVPTIGAGLIIVYCEKKTPLYSLLSNKILVGVGVISYSLYLWHQPILAFARYYSLVDLSILIKVGLIFFIFFISYFSWKYIELPFREIGYFGDRLFLKIITVFSILILIISLFISTSYVNSMSFDNSYLGKLYSVSNQQKFNEGCWRQLSTEASVKNACEFGTLNKESSFAIVGDSHAGSFVAAFEEISLDKKIRGKNFTYTGCSAAENETLIWRGDSTSICKQFSKSFYDGLGSNLIPETLIVISRWQIMIDGMRFNNAEGGIEAGNNFELMNDYGKKTDIESAVAKNITNSVKKMLAAGHRVILIYPIPEMGWDVPQRLGRIYLREKLITADDASVSYSRFLERNLKAVAALDEIGSHERLFRVYPKDFFCNPIKDRCYAHRNGVPFYFDDDHLSYYGSKLIAREIAEKFLKIN